MLQYHEDKPQEGGIAIIGIGGAGANVLKCFNASSADHVRLYTISLDERVGRSCGNVEFIQLGEGLSHGLGSGGDPEVGKQAMQESEQRIREILQASKLVVMVAGLGGGTGSGAAPELARFAREAGVFLVSVLMLPFSFEGKRRLEQAEQAHEQIARLSDIVFCFENDYMEELFRDRSGAREVFEEVDRLLAKATASVPMIATSPGLINLGLDELAAALENCDSRCVFGSGSGYGVGRAEQAARAAVESPLSTYHGALRFARKAIVHIAGGENMSVSEIRQAMDVVRDALGSEDVQIFFGTSVKASLGEEIRVTLIASIDAQEFKAACAVAPVPVRPEEDESDEVTEEERDEAEEDEQGQGEEEMEREEEDEENEETPEREDEEEPEEEGEEDSTEETLYDDEEEEARPISHETRAESRSAVERQQVPRQLDLFSTPAPQNYDSRERGEYVPPVATVHVRLPQHQDNDEPTGRAMSPAPVARRYVPVAGRRMPNVGVVEDDLDTPPSMRNSDLRDAFPN